jgi:hypothetical protein
VSFRVSDEDVFEYTVLERGYNNCCVGIGWERKQKGFE